MSFNLKTLSNNYSVNKQTSWNLMNNIMKATHYTQCHHIAFLIQHLDTWILGYHSLRCVDQFNESFQLKLCQ